MNCRRHRDDLREFRGLCQAIAIGIIVWGLLLTTGGIVALMVLGCSL